MARRKGASESDNERLIKPLLAWFKKAMRMLPWREGAPGKRDAYRSLVSEAMLQQTQVSRVIDKFTAFVARFPTVHSLAAADEREVTALWAGLGYYRRARNLHNAATMIVERFGGHVPRTVDELLELPGVGRYTAGAIASIAHNVVAPIVDGNVSRVLLRVEGRDVALDEQAAWVWGRADELATRAVENVGAFNEALMELGATICTPGAQPACNVCPWRGVCIARREGLQGQIPRPKVAKPSATLMHAALLLEDSHGRLLIERRPAKGLWAGLWQTPTLEATPETWSVVNAWLTNLARAGPLANLEIVKQFAFIRQLTHRRVIFEVWAADGGVAIKRKFAAKLVSEAIGPPGMFSIGAERVWAAREEALALGVSNAQRMVLKQSARAEGTEDS